MERRLTTIVAADMVGYSRLTAEDEEGTLDRLRAVRAELIDPEIQAAGGRIVKTMGDGLLVEFPSPVAAVRAVITVQSTMAAREADRPEDMRIVFRVGVNLGDVVIDGDDIMGDGVNIAARLEGLAEPGGITVSHSIYEQVKGKVDCGFTDLGPQQVKNIPDPVDVYSVSLDGIAVATRPMRRRKILATIAAVLVVAIIIGGYLTTTRQTDPLAGLPPISRSLSTASLIVLPFQDFSEDKSLGYFADGMTEDLITDLARWKEFRVIARNTSMTYKDKQLDVREVARETNVRYVLEGSVRRIGDEMRITAQLIDGQTGGHVWAERFEETGSDILELQDSVITRIVQTLIGGYGVIREDEYAKTWAKAATDLDEYDYYLRGHELFYRFTAKDNAEAIEIWREGLVKYPDSGLLKVKLAVGYYIVHRFQFPDYKKPISAVLALAEEGMSDPNLPPAGHRFGLWTLARLYSLMGDREATVDIATRTVKSYPFDAEGLLGTATALIFVGSYDLADRTATRALALDPPLSPTQMSQIGRWRYVQGDCVQALPLLKPLSSFPEFALMTAACQAELGQIDDARELIATLQTKFGIKSSADYPAVFKYMTGVPERMTAQLAKAGWPE